MVSFVRGNMNIKNINLKMLGQRNIFHLELKGLLKERQ